MEMYILYMKDNVCLLAIKIGILEMRLNDF